MIRKIADQSKQERKRKQVLDKIFDPTGHTPLEKPQKGAAKNAVFDSARKDTMAPMTAMMMMDRKKTSGVRTQT
jgi:hypothetical protein